MSFNKLGFVDNSQMGNTCQLFGLQTNLYTERDFIVDTYEQTSKLYSVKYDRLEPLNLGRVSVDKNQRRLWEEDWQQLLCQLEILVKDFVMEARSHLKTMQNIEDVPVHYLEGLLTRYGAFCVAAQSLMPFLSELESLLMRRFSISFELLNKCLIKSCLYSDTFIQNNIPLYISQPQCTNQELIHSCLLFDEEISEMAYTWLDAKKFILKFSDKCILLENKSIGVSESWEKHRDKDVTTYKKSDSRNFDIKFLSFINDIASNVSEFEFKTKLENKIKRWCKNCRMETVCSCNDCTIKHVLICGLDTQSASLKNKAMGVNNLKRLELDHPVISKMSDNNTGEKAGSANFFKSEKSIIQPLLVNSESYPSCQMPDISNYAVCQNETIECVDKKSDKVEESDTYNDDTTISTKKKILQIVLDKVTQPAESERTVKCKLIKCNTPDNLQIPAHIVSDGNKSTSPPNKNVKNVKEVNDLNLLSLDSKNMSKKESSPSGFDQNNVKLDKRRDPYNTYNILKSDNKQNKSSIYNKKNIQSMNGCSKTEKCGCCNTSKKEHLCITPKTTETDSHRKNLNSLLLHKNCNGPYSRRNLSQSFSDHNCVEETKNCKVLRHCDCPYNEAFEALSPDVNNKFNKMRDRLRNRLNEKRKNKFKNTSNQNYLNDSNVNKYGKRQLKELKLQFVDTHKFETNENVDTRDIKDLLNFIEGTEKRTNLVSSIKKSNRKLRRQEKKMQEHSEDTADSLNDKHTECEKLVNLEETHVKDQTKKIVVKEEECKSVKIKNNSYSNNNMHNVNKMSTVKKKNNSHLQACDNIKSQLVKTGPMVTIKRIMEGTNKEPTVTITLKGSTPDKDKLLYTLINGQSNSTSHSNKEVLEVSKPTLSRKQKKKLKKENAVKKEPLGFTDTNNIKNDKIKNGHKFSKVKVQSNNKNKKYNETKSTAIENSVTVSLHSKSEAMLNLQMLRLPPGITITKVEGPAVNKKLSINTTKNNSVSHTAPTDNHSGIIVVDTVKLKEGLSDAEKNISLRNKKNKKKKNKKVETCNKQQCQKSSLNKSSVNIVSNLSSTNSRNGSSMLTLKNPMFYQLQESVNEKMQRDAKLIESQQTDNNQQASIIKGANGMVTIRSPRLSNVGGTCNGRGIPFMSLQNVGAPVLSELKPLVGPNSPNYIQSYKKENKKTFNAQEILSGLPGIEITKINKNSLRNKSECKKVFQPADVSIIPTNTVNGTSGDIYKLFYDNSDWSLESVFTPKEIKEDEVLDADELEVEAFKRFCLQSVPAERKEKVAYLNVKDIILKKKSSNIC